MVVCLWVACSVLSGVIIILSVKLHLMKKSVEEITAAFSDRLTTDTNTLIGVSCNDPYIKRLARDINTQLQKLRAERLRFQHGDAELKEAVTNISHDLRTPLTAIYGYLELLENEEKSETADRYLSQIKNRTEALVQLTEELFRYSVVASEKGSCPERVDLRRVLEESLLSFYGVFMEKGIEPVISLAETPVERLLDPVSLSRIFGNIISNAVKYSDGDFRVHMDADGAVVFSNIARGLDTVSVGRLFDRFYTLETGRNSTGLGLSIARLLTERMGGTVKADYKEQQLLITVNFPK
ncbi:MAG: HAMP domain-containing histidine kinase [Clostridiales bacterium]|nr:HAMP domain-containing histidine kinase [Clostridiales bacterium]